MIINPSKPLSTFINLSIGWHSGLEPCSPRPQRGILPVKLKPPEASRESNPNLQFCKLTSLPLNDFAFSTFCASSRTRTDTFSLEDCNAAVTPYSPFNVGRTQPLSQRFWGLSKLCPPTSSRTLGGIRTHTVSVLSGTPPSGWATRAVFVVCSSLTVVRS